MYVKCEISSQILAYQLVLRNFKNGSLFTTVQLHNLSGQIEMGTMRKKKSLSNK